MRSRLSANRHRDVTEASPTRHARPGRCPSLAGGRDVHRLRGHLDRPRARLEGRLTCLELDEKFAAIARRNLEDAGVADRVEIIVGPALESLRVMPPEPTFDYVFLDADKTGYPDYYEELIPRLLQGGLLLVDNVILRGRVTDPQDEQSRIMDALNARVTADERVDSAMVLVADGLTFVRRR
jgi:caffeoyl-CoA O-methyltransferase